MITNRFLVLETAVCYSHKKTITNSWFCWETAVCCSFSVKTSENKNRIHKHHCKKWWSGNTLITWWKDPKGGYDPGWPVYSSASADPGECRRAEAPCGPGGGGGGNDWKWAAAAAAATPGIVAAKRGDDVNKEWRLGDPGAPVPWSGGLGVVKVLLLLPLDGVVHNECKWSATEIRKQKTLKALKSCLTFYVELKINQFFISQKKKLPLFIWII